MNQLPKTLWLLAMLGAFLVAPTHAADDDDPSKNPRLGRLTVRHWRYIGPFGGPWLAQGAGLPQENRDRFYRDEFPKYKYPPDEAVRVNESYRDEVTIDAAGNSRRLEWERSKDTSTPKLTAALGIGRGYFITWIKADEDCPVDVRLTGYDKEERTRTRQELIVNGQEIPVRPANPLHPYAAHSAGEVTLRKGWNFFFVRTTAWGPGLKCKLEIYAPLARLRELDPSYGPRYGRNVFPNGQAAPR